jgi:hypothetical protein
LIFELDGVNAHQRGFMHFGAIRPDWRASTEIDTKSIRSYYGHPWLAVKRLVRAMQFSQFRAKSTKNDLKPTNFPKRNSYFEIEGVVNENYEHLLGSNGSLEFDGYYTCEEVLKTYSSFSFIQA